MNIQPAADKQTIEATSRQDQASPASEAAGAMIRPRLKRLLTFVLWAAIFGIAFTQWPLYAENQNTKFLHGLAAAGYGSLARDWLANTIDPLPAFTTIVFLTYRYLHPWLFYLYHAFLLSLYLLSLTAIADRTFGIGRSRPAQFIFMTLIIWLHAGLLWPFSLEILGTSLGWLLQAGVANQYLLNPVFQPSTFGVLFFVSIWLFLADRPYWAALFAALAPVLHSTYLPGAGILTASYMVIIWREEGALRKPLAMGLAALLVVTPVLLYNVLLLGPTDPASFAQSQSILVNDRIPHHSLPSVWLDGTVAVKLALVLIALLLVWRTRLFPIMAIPALTAVGLTALQLLLPTDLVAFIAPWRMSVFLVPLATGMIVAAALGWCVTRFNEQPARYARLIMPATGLILAAIVLTGARAIASSAAAQRADVRNGVYAFAAANQAPDTVFLVPSHMAEFRLATGVPVVITWKSHPYKDVEVLAWKERVDAVNGFYGEPHCIRMGELHHTYGATHILFEGTPPDQECPIVETVYADEHYTVLQVK